MARVIIGMDPHKRSATIEIIDDREKVLAQGRFGTDRDGYRAMLAVRPQVSRPGVGGRGLLRHRPAHRPTPGRRRRDGARRPGEAVGAGAGVRDRTGPQDRPGRRPLAWRWPRLRATGLRQVAVDDTTVALRLLVDRRDVLGRARTDRSTASTSCCWSCCPAARRSSCPRRRPAPCSTPCGPGTSSGAPAAELASELITELVGIDKKIKAANAG